MHADKYKIQIINSITFIFPYNIGGHILIKAMPTEQSHPPLIFLVFSLQFYQHPPLSNIHLHTEGDLQWTQVRIEPSHWGCEAATLLAVLR